MGFSRGNKKKGVEHLSTYLKIYKIGDIVDVKGCGAFPKGMPHKSYHGKTGRVQRVQAGCRCGRQQEGQGKDPAQEDFCPYRACETLPVQEGLFGPSARQRSEEARAEGYWQNRRVQEIPL